MNEFEINETLDNSIDAAIAKEREKAAAEAQLNLRVFELTKGANALDSGFKTIVLEMVKNKQFDLAESNLKGLKNYSVWMKNREELKKQGYYVNPTLSELFAVMN
jgi:hypothetical protein